MKKSTENLKNLPPEIIALIADVHANYQEIILANEKVIAEKDQRIVEKEQQIESLEYRLQLVLQARYVSRTEKLSPEDKQASLFDEPQALSELQQKEIAQAEQEINVASYQRKKSGRRPLPSHLPRIQHIHDLKEEGKICHCGHELKCIGEEKSEQLEIIKPKMQVIQNIRLKYACKHCEETIKTAELPLQVIPKSIATPGLLAHVLVSKYCDHLPLYRQENILNRIGVDIPRMTLCQWMMKCGELLSLLIEIMKNHIITYDIAHADETKVQVLKEKGRTAQQLSYMWLYIGGEKEKRCTVYEYQPTRSGVVAEIFLKGFKGYLHVDGYGGYERLFDKGIIGVGCMAHARRKFIEITKINKKEGLAVFAVNQIAKLYQIEKEAKLLELTAEEIKELREEKAKSLLKEFKQWLDEHIRKVPPQSPIAKAINYSLNQWQQLIRYCADGRLEIDNNRAERAIKSFVTGRKNWLFCGNENGARAGATIFSLVETCKDHGIEPYEYFKYVLSNIRTANTKEALEKLLPFNCGRQLLDNELHLKRAQCELDFKKPSNIVSS